MERESRVTHEELTHEIREGGREMQWEHIKLKLWLQAGNPLYINLKGGSQ